MKVNDSHNSTSQQCCKTDVHILRKTLKLMVGQE